jgi:hypothetical protein
LAKPGNTAGYVLLSNIYANAAGKWDANADVQQWVGKGCSKKCQDTH